MRILKGGSAPPFKNMLELLFRSDDPAYAQFDRFAVYRPFSRVVPVHIPNKPLCKGIVGDFGSKALDYAVYTRVLS